MLILFFRLTRADDLVFHLIEKNLGISLDLDFITIGAHTVYPLILFGNPKRDEIMILGKPSICCWLSTKGDSCVDVCIGNEI